MKISNMFLISSIIFLFFSSCSQTQDKTLLSNTSDDQINEQFNIIPGADRLSFYLPLLKGKTVGLVVNQTSLVGSKHLLDVLMEEGIEVAKLFAPEHGIRGAADAGEKINDSIDEKSGLQIVSLYGKNKKPSAAQLKGLDVIVFDIQDVGVRFYTYISTLHYVLEASAENNVDVVILDRPNPNGHYVDGPVLDDSFKSFVGMHPVPMVYGMTIGEYGQMINGEGWLKDGVRADLKVIACQNYTHDANYDLPIKPSPNLPNRKSVLLYPSLCLFEGSSFSIGRGTDQPFQLLAHPKWKKKESITPKSTSGAKYPKHENKECGVIYFDYTDAQLKRRKLNLSYLHQAMKSSKELGFEFFENKAFFDKLAGTDILRKQLVQGLDLKEIRASWQDELSAFKLIREKYLIY